MAGASMNDIKARIKSVESTMQITKAMELVATSKLRRTKAKAESTRPFYEVLGKAIDDVLASEEISSSVWCEQRSTSRALYIVIAGDRGLAGGYNANVFRLTDSLAGIGDTFVFPVGKKAFERYRHRKNTVISDEYEYVSTLGVSATAQLAQQVCDGFIRGEYDKVYIVYTKFVSMLTQAPVYEQLLPLERDTSGCDLLSSDMPPEEILEKLVPYYVGGIIYSAVIEALASEQGARRTAMNAANKNAAEMIDTLMLKYNRARQAIITQEITEIVSGAEASN